MAVRQSNHDVWHLPECLHDIAADRQLLLWEAVARWTWLQDRSVSRDELARAFHITPRRAADVVRYILLSQTHVVTCSSQVVRREGDGVRQMQFQVTHVMDRSPPRSPVTSRPRRSGATAARRHEVAELRKAFLRKAVG
jgi:hypothetical protein